MLAELLLLEDDEEEDDDDDDDDPLGGGGGGGSAEDEDEAFWRSLRRFETSLARLVELVAAVEAVVPVELDEVADVVDATSEASVCRSLLIWLIGSLPLASVLESLLDGGGGGGGGAADDEDDEDSDCRSDRKDWTSLDSVLDVVDTDVSEDSVLRSAVICARGSVDVDDDALVEATLDVAEVELDVSVVPLVVWAFRFEII